MRAMREAPQTPGNQGVGRAPSVHSSSGSRAFSASRSFTGSTG